MNAMHSSAKVASKAIATAFDLTCYKTACDLGGEIAKDPTVFYLSEIIPLYFMFTIPGCTGVMAYEFIKAHPQLSVTVFDLPLVVELSESFHPQHTDNRVSFKAGQLSLFIYSKTLL